MKNKILIGSKAAAHWFSDFRECKDVDYIQPYPHPPKIKGVEYKFTPAFQWLLDNEEDIASSNALYTIKVSHSFWDIHWDKTINDILYFKSKGCKVIEPFYKLLYQDWTEIHGCKKVNLNMSNDDFFDKSKGINRIYQHDDLHKAIMYYDEPMYDRLKTDKSKAFISESVFLNQSYQDQLRTCWEEIMVLSLERYLIPQLDMNTIVAYTRAAKRLVTRMSKGWFPRFIVENWDMLKRPDKDNLKYFEFIDFLRNK
jgi:hypothetical protein